MCRYPELAATDAHVSQYYMWYIHVAIMIYVGFGFLMTFLRYLLLHLYSSFSFAANRNLSVSEPYL